MGTAEETELEVDEIEENDLDDNDLDEELEDNTYETVEETLKRVQEETKPSDEQESINGGEGQNAEQGQQAEGAQTAETGQQLVPILPPDRFTAEAKEAFKNAPRVLQEQYEKAVRDLERGHSGKLNEVNKIRQEAETVINAVAPWAKDWATRGVSAPQGIALLAQTHERLVENPAKEIARLIKDNGITVDDVTAVMQGGSSTNGNGQGYEVDVTQNPQYLALQEKVNWLENSYRDQVAKSETEKVAALREQVDANGNRPFEHILSEEFLRYAQPLVSALRTPPRGADGKFTSGPMAIEEAYKRAYRSWQLETGQLPQVNAPGQQPLPANGTQNITPKKSAEPVSMRPRNRPVGATVSKSTPAAFLNESPEETVARLRGDLGS